MKFSLLEILVFASAEYLNPLVVEMPGKTGQGKTGAV
jgi:hypothetical protein